nr:MAK10-like protein [Tanacetum cinerariifolium]
MFNTIITGLKALDEYYSSKTYVRKFLRALHPKCRAKIMVIEELKDLTSPSIDERIRNLKVHELIIKKDYEIVRGKEEKRYLALKVKKESSDEKSSTSGSEDEEYTMEEMLRCGDPNHLVGECLKPSRYKNQRALVRGSWSDSGEEEKKRQRKKRFRWLKLQMRAYKGWRQDSHNDVRTLTIALGSNPHKEALEDSTGRRHLATKAIEKIKLPDRKNVVPLRFDTIRLVPNECSFHGLRFEDPNQHLKDFLKLVDSLDLDVENMERMLLCLFQFFLRDQASNWLERLPVRSIFTWEDLTTHFLVQFIPMEMTAKLWNDILMFQQHQVQIFSDHVNPATRRTIDQSASGKLRDKNTKESWVLLEDLALYENESWNDPKDFAKLVKEISLLQYVLSTSDRHINELKNQAQCLMEAHLARKSNVQVNKITSSYEIFSGSHDTQYCMENLKQAFVDYASSCTDEARGKWYTFKPEKNNLGDTYNPSWKSHPNLKWRQP